MEVAVAEVLVALIGAMSTVLVAYMSVLGKRLTRINQQVSNSHGSNLRDDLDRISIGVEQVINEQHRQAAEQHRHTAELGALRSELTVERTERAALGERVTRVETDIYR
jgi:hypothetical protein